MAGKKSSPFAINKKLSIYIEFSVPEIENYLKFNTQMPLLVVEQIMYDQGDNSIGWGKTYYKKEFGKVEAFSSFAETKKVYH